ncbi:hypothetical protein Vau01_048510 [Virgisporangium aurantiacum]|uniref:Lysylphosphatidylglycerol synthase TM region n=1 Tax=Virgisporangium aurantiacum TaxID=175570 RepID=A0A8J3Z9C9_9ACTN|nr:hypothetical protein Vau01_048510 [Virgisporangium aurantiacum]
MLGLAAAGVLVALVAADRADVPAAARALRDAHPVWLSAGAAALLVWWAAWVLLHATSRQAAGISGGAAELARLVPLALGAVAVNSAVKSGGLAGVALFDGDGRARSLSRGRVHAGYLLALAFTEVAFLVTLALGVVLARWNGQLTRGESAAVAVFLVFLVVRGAALVAAVRSREALRRTWSVPARLWDRVRRRPARDHDVAAADEFYAAVALLRSRPAAAVVPLVAAVAVDFAGVAMVWTAIGAVGGGSRPGTALIAYAVSAVFGIVGVLPGGLGFAEVGVVAVLVSAGTPTGVAAAAAVVFRVWEFWVPLLVGAPLAWWSRRAQPVDAS